MAPSLSFSDKFYSYLIGLYKIYFSWTQNRFRCTCVCVHAGNCARKRADVYVTNNNMILQRGGRNCTKLVLKPFAVDFSPVYCSFPVDYTVSVYMMTTLYFYSLYTMRSIYIASIPFLINWNEKSCGKSNIMIMDHQLVLENSSLAAVYILPNTIIYLKAIKYLTIRLRQIY